MSANSGANWKGIVLTAAVLIAGTAFASSKGSLELQHATSVAGKQLQQGNYTVRWDGTGDQVQVKIYKGKNEVASAPARVVKVQAPQANSAVVNTDSNGGFSLAEIRFGGKDYALQILSDAAGSGSSSGASR